MYKLYLDKDKATEKIVMNSIYNMLPEAHWKKKDNGCQTLSFKIPFSSNCYDKIKERESYISIYDEYDDLKPRFKGKVLSVTTDFKGNKKVYVEGQLALLNNIMMLPYDYNGTVDGFVQSIFDQYNSMAKDEDKLYLGTITVTDPNNYITRSNEDYSSCWECLTEKCVKMLGGHLLVRYEIDGKTYVDYLTELPKNTQKIVFGENMVDCERYIDTTNIATVLIPLGHEDEESNERLTIETLNDGSIYLESDLISRFGRIEKVVEWDDVTVVENLYRKAQDTLNELKLKSIHINAKGADLGFTSEQIKRFEVGGVDVIMPPMNVNDTLFASEIDVDLCNPINTKITCGAEQKTFTSASSSSQAKIDQIDKRTNESWLESFIKEQTSIIAGGLGGNMRIMYNQNSMPSGVAFMDSDNVVNAREVLLISYAGIGFSHTGISGPFLNAWDILGRLSADFIKAGKLVGKMFEFDLNTGICKWGKRDENGDFIDGASIVFDAETMIIQAKKGLEVDDPTTDFKSTINERYWQITYQDDIKLYFDPNGGFMSNLSIDKYLNISNTGRFQKFVANIGGKQRTMLGMFYLGGNQ